jgi:Na+-driven multidrug efflux pump
MSHKDNEYQRRLFLLSGAHIPVILSVTLPLLFYSSLTLVFSFFDTFTAANMNANVLTTVSFASDIRNMLNAISWGLSVGVGVMISRSFGNGDMEQVKTEMSTVFFFALFIAVSLLIVVIPFSRPILRLVAFPEELLSSGAFFLSIEVVTLVFSFINSIFFTTEKARGRTKIVMYGNLIVLGIKTLLNFVIIALVSSGTLSSDIAMYLLPVASGIAFGSISIYALKRMFSKKNIFRISFKSACFRKKMLLPFAKLSFPVIIEKVMIPFGKVICNSLFIGFGTVGVAAFSCSQRILSLTTSPLNSFKDAESTIISTNLGNRDTKRALSFLFYSCLVTFAAGIILFIVVALSSEFLIGFFAKGNADLAIKMRNIYLVERWDFLFCALDGSMCGLLYALKKTKLPTIVNIVKLF